MSEASFLQFLENSICSRKVHSARCKIVTAMDDLVACNFNQLNGLGVSWLEANRSTSSNIETVAISFDAIKLKLRICFDEVVVGSNLYMAKQVNRS